jgi:excisionase family DNA binding protein
MFSAHVQLADRDVDVDEKRLETMLTELADFHPSIGTSPRGWLSARISLPGESISQAASTALAVVQAASRSIAIAIDIMTETEFEAVQGFAPIADLLSVSEAAEYLGVTRVRTSQMIEEHKLPGATKVGNTFVIPRGVVEAQALRAVVLGTAGGDGPREEHHDQVFGPAYSALRIVGVWPAFAASQAAARGEEHNPALAEAWDEAERDVLSEMRMLGYSADGLRIIAKRLAR